MLEPLRLEHAGELAPLLADPALHAFTGGEPDAPDALRARIARQVAGRSPDGRDVWRNWVLRDGPHAVGTVQATIRPGRVAEVAWVIFTPFQGRGHARAAAVALVDWLLAGPSRHGRRAHPPGARRLGRRRARRGAPADGRATRRRGPLAARPGRRAGRAVSPGVSA